MKTDTIKTVYLDTRGGQHESRSGAAKDARAVVSIYGMKG